MTRHDTVVILASSNTTSYTIVYDSCNARPGNVLYIKGNITEYVKIRLYYELYFYYYLPYVLLDELTDVDPDCVGLFGLNKTNEKIA